MPRWKGTYEQVIAIEEEVKALKQSHLDPYESTLRHNGGATDKLFPYEEPQQKVCTRAYEIFVNPAVRSDPRLWKDLWDIFEWLTTDSLYVRFSYNHIKGEFRFDVTRDGWDKLIGCQHRCNGKAIMPRLRQMVEGMERDKVNGG